MDRLSEELRSIKTNNLKYLYILIFFVTIYAAFIYYDIYFVYHLIFIIGLGLFVYSYEKLERELASVKMKNFYIKAKLTYQIDELEGSISKSKDDYNKKVLHNILEEMEL